MASETGVVLVGAGQGIGLLTTKYLLKYLRAQVVAFDLDITQLETLRETYKGQLHCLKGDITNASDRQKLKELALQNLPHISTLLITSGIIGQVARTAEQDEKALLRSYQVNTFGPILMSQLFLPEIRQVRGRIIILSSAVDRRVKYSGWGQYCASKAALTRFIEVLAHEEPDVKVQGVYPGLTKTGMPADIIAGKYSGIMYPYEIQRFQDWDKTGAVEPPEWCAKAAAELAAGVLNGLESGTTAYYYEHVPDCKEPWKPNSHL